jgi:hypothetical protein
VVSRRAEGRRDPAVKLAAFVPDETRRTAPAAHGAFRKKAVRDRGREYVQLVESYRDDAGEQCPAFDAIRATPRR